MLIDVPNVLGSTLGFLAGILAAMRLQDREHRRRLRLIAALLLAEAKYLQSSLRFPKGKKKANRQHTRPVELSPWLADTILESTALDPNIPMAFSILNRALVHRRLLLHDLCEAYDAVSNSEAESLDALANAFPEVLDEHELHVDRSPSELERTQEVVAAGELLQLVADWKVTEAQESLEKAQRELGAFDRRLHRVLVSLEALLTPFGIPQSTIPNWLSDVGLWIHKRARRLFSRMVARRSARQVDPTHSSAS